MTVPPSKSATDPDGRSTLPTPLELDVRQDPVAEPFEVSGELGKPPGDPLDPNDYAVEIEAPDANVAVEYAFRIDGAILEAPDGATVADGEGHVTGQLSPGDSITMAVRGVIRWIETDQRVDVAVESLS